jgi:glycosyltransferase involved in cell wall biosynthesis
MFDLLKFKTTPLPTEDEVMTEWPNEKNETIVSIICCAYNHELYIEDAIRGFLMQKTNFKFEIIIHDDASTDSTAAIIIRFRDRYPKIIRLVLQKYNQYSIAPNSIFLIPVKYSKGKYLAVCEGDDFWFDGNKLQIQKDTLDKNPDCSFVAHNAFNLYANGAFDIFRNIPVSFKFTHIDILNISSQFAPTASYFFDRKVVDELPYWFKDAPIGDLFVELYSLKIGVGIYICDSFSIYRRSVVNSWSTRTSKSSESRKKNILMFISCFEKLQLDFQDSNIKISNRIFLLLHSLAREISNNNIFKFPDKTDALTYMKIREKARLQRCSNLFKFNIKFPSSLIIFNLFKQSEYIWSRAIYIFIRLNRLSKRIIYNSDI